MVTSTVWLAGGASVAVILVGGLVALYVRRRSKGIDEQIERLVEKHDSDEPITFTPPDVRLTPLGILTTWWHLARASRMANKTGYVKWYRLGSTMSRPQWVKPEADGAGTPKVKVDGQPYYFPKESMVSDDRTGAWVAIHREGEADPLNLRDPAYPGIEVDLMERIINLEAEDKPPGWFDSLNLDTQTMMYLGIGVLFLIYAAYRYMNGGVA